MGGLTKVIAGSGLTISGTILWFLILIGLDYSRVRTYGLFHEIGLYSFFFTFVFILGTVMLVYGIILILSGLGNAKKDNDEYDFTID